MKVEKLNTLDSSTKLQNNLLDEFHDPDVREVYVDEFLNAKISTQIKVLREQQGLTQEELAERAGMKQERIAVLENVNYESWTLNVLRRLAKAFDLRVDVEFKEFGSFFEDASLGRESLERRKFENDPVFKRLKKEGVVKFPTTYEPTTGVQQPLPLFDTDSVVNLKTYVGEKAKHIEQLIREEAEPVVELTFKATA